MREFVTRRCFGARGIIYPLLLLLFTACSDGSGSGSDNASKYTISLSKNSLQFTAQRNGPTPASQLIDIGYNGQGLIIGYPGGVPEPTWLNVSVAGAQTDNPLSVEFSIVSTNLSPGNYSTTVRVLTGNLAQTEGTSRDIAISYTVTENATVTVNRTLLQFVATIGASAPAAQSVTISGSSWTASTEQSWIALGVNSGSGTTDLPISVNLQGLTVGDYTGNVSVVNSANGDTINIAVHLAINNGTMTLSNRLVNFSGTNGKAISSQQVLITLSGDNNATWTATTTLPWLKLNNQSASTSGNSQLALNLNVDAQAANLASGNYSGIVSVSASINGIETTDTINVSLNLSPMTFSVSANSVSFSAINGNTIAAKSLSISLDTDINDFTWTAKSTDSWLKVNGLSEVSNLNQGVVELSIDASTLVSNTYNTVLQVSAVVNGDSLVKNIPVSLILTPAAITITPTNLTLNVVNGNDISAKTFNFSLNTGSNAYTWNASIDLGNSSQSWLNIDKSTGTVSSTQDTISVSINSSILSSGVYNGAISISTSINGDTITKSIPVSLNLIQPTISATNSSLNFSGVNGSTFDSKAVSISLDTGSNAFSWNATLNQGGATSTWLALDIQGGNLSSTPATVNVSVDTSLLSSGIYNGEINLSANVNGDTVTKIIPVVLNLTLPTISVTPVSLAFSGVNGSDLGSQSISASVNTGTNAYGYDLTFSDTWLTSSSSGQLSATASVLDFAIDASNLISGSYTGTITISAIVNGDTISTDIPVTLDLTLPFFSLSAADLLFEGVNTSDLGTQSVGLSLNTGAISYPINVQITADNGNAGSWLMNSNAPIGAINASETLLDFSIDASGMLGGIYNGSVTITAQINGDSINTSLPITLRLQPHRLFIADPGIALASFPTATSATSWTVTVSENGGKPVSWTANTQATWLSVSANGTSGGTLTVTANPSNLTKDTLYQTTISVSSSDPSIENVETVKVGFWLGANDPLPSENFSFSAQQVIADPVRPYIYMDNGGSDLSVYNIYTLAPVTTITTSGARLGDLAISSDGSMLYVVDDTNFKVIPIDLNSYAESTAWNLAVSSTRQIAYARPEGRSVLIADDGLIYNLDSPNSAPVSNSLSSFYSYSLAASANGNRYCAINRGISPYSLHCLDMKYNFLDEALIVYSNSRGSIPFNSGSNGSDVALNSDGSLIYAASGAPYEFIVFDGSDFSIIKQRLPAAPYPNSIEVGPNDLVYGGINGTYAPTDLWVYNANGVEQYSANVTGTILPRQLVVSGEGLRIISLTSNATVDFFSP